MQNDERLDPQIWRDRSGYSNDRLISAEHLISAERGWQIIGVAAKSLIGQSDVKDLEQALEEVFAKF